MLNAPCMTEPILLASASPRRSELLNELNLDFKVIPSEAEEVHDAVLGARETCRINARSKGEWVANRNPESIVLGADTLVFMGSEIFGKPADLPEAFDMLEKLQGKEHQVVTAFCLVRIRPFRLSVVDVVTSVRMKPLIRSEIASYFQLVNPLDKAGSYAIQEHGDRIVERFEGSYSNVIGLPLEELKVELLKWSLPVATL